MIPPICFLSIYCHIYISPSMNCLSMSYFDVRVFVSFVLICVSSLRIRDRDIISIKNINIISQSLVCFSFLFIISFTILEVFIVLQSDVSNFHLTNAKFLVLLGKASSTSRLIRFLKILSSNYFILLFSDYFKCIFFKMFCAFIFSV